MRVTLLIASMFFITACSMFTPEQKNALVTFLGDELASGKITQDQYNNLMAVFTGNNWSSVIDTIVSTGLGIVGSLTGVRLLRGPALATTERVAVKTLTKTT